MDRLKAIETFVRIAQTGSLSKAAQELGMSRALASTHLRQLEDHLGARLLNRTTRQLSLTEAGQEYLTFSQAALASFEEAEQSITRSRDEPRGTLKILASMAFGNLHLAPTAAEFSLQHPDIKISLILTDTSFSPFDLIDQGYDLAVWMHAIEDMSIISAKLGDVRWPALASPDYLAKHPKPRHPSDLAQHPCLFAPLDRAGRELAVRRAGRSGLGESVGPAAHQQRVRAAGGRAGWARRDAAADLFHPG